MLGWEYCSVRTWPAFAMNINLIEDAGSSRATRQFCHTNASGGPLCFRGDSEFFNRLSHFSIMGLFQCT